MGHYKRQRYKWGNWAPWQKHGNHTPSPWEDVFGQVTDGQINNFDMFVMGGPRMWRWRWRRIRCLLSVALEWLFDVAQITDSWWSAEPVRVCSWILLYYIFPEYHVNMGPVANQYGLCTSKHINCPPDHTHQVWQTKSFTHNFHTAHFHTTSSARTAFAFTAQDRSQLWHHSLGDIELSPSYWFNWCWSGELLSCSFYHISRGTVPGRITWPLTHLNKPSQWLVSPSACLDDARYINS